MKTQWMLRLSSIPLALLLFTCSTSPQLQEHHSIRPYSQNPFYWSYKGEPILLIGGSKEDNLFQIPDLEEHLTLLREAGGNYVRNTMSSRDEGNLWPYEKDPATGLFDLNKPNADYWDRLLTFLERTGQLDIIVQIEVWATFDYYDDRNMRRGFWQKNPFNPKNNINYTTEESGLPEIVDSHPVETKNPFFFSIPAIDNNVLLLNYQQAFVRTLLSHALAFDHVLYCMDNETSVRPEWGAFWAEFITQEAASLDKSVQITEMWDPWDLSHEMHSNTFDHPDTYSFVDVSQNNHNTGQQHWDNAQRQRQRIMESGQIRPMSNVKVYGADDGPFGTDRDGVERFWRNIFGGMASSRFHRPASGIGLNALAQTHIRSADMFTNRFPLFTAQPALEMLKDRSSNEAYGLISEEGDIAVLFPDSGSVSIDATGLRVQYWLNIEENQWIESSIQHAPPDPLVLSTPGSGFWIAILTK